ncbi:MAG: class I SAM-dependent methyltransferase [Gammaproteobacteria bacterium]|nr:class I SAM-dependent methyltransferase [Gammaproteobacteria bacterium]
MHGDAARVRDDVLPEPVQTEAPRPAEMPDYLEHAYWWAYLRPGAVRFFDRPWLVNLILYGNYFRLRDAALAELPKGASQKTLQVACVYGDFTEQLRAHLGPDATLDVVDVAPIQLENTRRKMGGSGSAAFHLQDSARLSFAPAHFDNVIVFFLLHEQPDAVRRATIDEALRVTRPGGKTIFVDYHRPSRWNPFRYFAGLVFWLLEPFASDFWARDISAQADADLHGFEIKKQRYFGGLYQKTVFSRPGPKQGAPTSPHRSC